MAQHIKLLEWEPDDFVKPTCVGVYLYVCVILYINQSGFTIYSNIRGCQSSTWSQRGTQVNWSHHGDNPLQNNVPRFVSCPLLPGLLATRDVDTILHANPHINHKRVG